MKTTPEDWLKHWPKDCSALVRPRRVSPPGMPHGTVNPAHGDGSTATRLQFDRVQALIRSGIGKGMQVGRAYLNGAPFDRALPFGGYKQSGNGREFGRFMFEEYLDVKALLGF